MAERTIVIGRRFRGPDMGGGPGARGVQIMRPAGVPLDRPLVVRVGEGNAVLSDDEGPIARTTTADLAVAVPAPPPVDVARRSRPDAAFLDEAGHLRPEFVWSALDCPGGGAIAGPANTGTLQVEILGPVDGRQERIVTGWTLAVDSARPGSRRRYAGTAVFDARGRLLARGAAIWVAPRAA
jgi:hypothetical protein